MGTFIAENLVRDPASKVFGRSVIGLLAHDLHDFVSAAGPAILHRFHGTEPEAESAHREMLEKLTKVLGEDNLVGSAGEFGLFLPSGQHREPRTSTVSRRWRFTICG